MQINASPTLRKLGQRVSVAAWATAVVGTVATLILPGPDDGPVIRLAVLVTILVFFALLLASIVIAVIRNPDRRLGLTVFIAGVSLWAAGAASVATTQTAQTVTFPNPGEALFLLSYVGIAAFLLLDVRRHTAAAVEVWLEVAVVCGAASCVAAVAVLTPLAGAFTRDGIPLLLAILYPLIDLILGTLVLGQMLLRQRDRNRSNTALVIGFLALAVADSSFILTLSSDTYSTSTLLDLLWGASFAVIVTAACARPSRGKERPVRPQHTATLIAAAAIALVVLVVHPSGTIGAVVSVPAIVTLICVGARMVVALREARRATEELRLSLTDELTGLPNRRAVLAAADGALANNTPLGFMLLDLDNFKDINDSLGHIVGDAVLTTVAYRIRAAMARDVVVARLGGDEFALYVPEEREVELLLLAQRVLDTLIEPVQAGGFAVTIRASLGVTVGTAEDTSAAELMRRADIAMYEAKAARCGALLYDTSQDGLSHQRLQHGESLRQAITAGQLVVWYQPQIDAVTRRVTALEALVRWNHPIDGILPPIAFLPDARRTGLMPALSDVVMRQAVADARRWLDADLDLRVAMNCAPPELLGGQFLPSLFAALKTSGLSGERVLVEVTEDSFLSDPERARYVLQELRNHDVEVSIDDYGTGFSSLAYLRDLPVQELKMDRTFVSGLLTDDRSRLIVEATSQMAHALGLRLVAEGVEDAATATELQAMGVDLLQGYHFAKPMPAAEVADWVRRWNTQAAPVSADGLHLLPATRPARGPG